MCNVTVLIECRVDAVRTMADMAVSKPFRVSVTANDKGSAYVGVVIP